MLQLHTFPLDIINELQVPKELWPVLKYFKNLMNAVFYKKYSFDSSGQNLIKN